MPPPPPPAMLPWAPAGAVRVGVEVAAINLISQAPTVYPSSRESRQFQETN